MTPAATHFDPVVGIDVHIVQPPGPVPPVPVPHPYVGIVFDPADYIPILGSTVKVNGMHRAIAGTAGKALPMHIPIGGVFVKPPANEDENFMGSSTVSMDGDAAAYMGLPCLSCQCVGIIPPFRVNPKKKTKIKSLVAPTSVVLPIPKGPPVLVGGPPTISLMNIAMSLGMAGLARGLKRLANSGAAKKAMAAFRRGRQRLFRNMNPGFLKCKILRAEPVDVVTGEVVVDQLDFDLPGRIPLPWTRHYQSGNERRGTCGYGWETPADARLEVSGNGTVLFHDGTGVTSYFDSLPGDRSVREPVSGAKLLRMDGHLIVRRKGGLRYYFPLSASRRVQTEIEVSAILDASHNSWHFLRDEHGLKQIVESRGRTLDIQSEGGLIRRVYLVHPDSPERVPLVAYDYDHEDNLVAVKDATGAPYRFTYSGHNLTSHTSRGGLSFYYEFDRADSDGRVLHTWGDGGLYYYRFRYDPDNRWTEVTDSLGNISLVEYDERLLIVRETDPLDGVTTYGYDEVGRTVEVIDLAGRRTEYVYDEDGNLTSLGRPDGISLATKYDRDGNPVEQIDADGHMWKMAWDERGLLRGRMSPRGGKWLYKHNPAGDLVSLIDPKGAETAFEYDHFGSLTEIIDPLRNTQKFSFDALGKISAYTDGEGFKTRYAHDVKGRMTAIKSPSGAVTKYSYDLDDNLASVTDANGHTTRFTYFGQGEVAERHQADGTVVKYEYDTEERLTAVINEAGEVYKLIRDPLGRVIEEIDYWGNPKRYKYNRAGNVVATKDALNRVVRYEHDPLDRMVKRRFRDGGEEVFEYDGNGNLTVAENTTIRVERAYDPDGNMIREVQGDFVLEQEYDLTGNRTKRTSPDHVVEYGFDCAGRNSEIRLNGESLARMFYDKRGLVVHEELGDQLFRDHRYDAEGMVARQLLRKRDKPLVDRRYTRDPIGSVLRRETEREGKRDWVSYAYDAMERISRCVDSWGSNKEMEYGAANGLLRNAGKAQDGTTKLVYAETEWEFDVCGNLSQRSNDLATLKFEWDAIGRLTSATDLNESKIDFLYDALGRRVKKISSNRNVSFRWSQHHLISEKHACDYEREYVFGVTDFHPLSAIQGENYFFNLDQCGFPFDLLNSAGEVLWEAVDGKSQIAREGDFSIEQNFRFCGQYFDEEIGLSYNYQRYYDPLANFFVSIDPLRQWAGHSLYHYAPNVWSWIDPLGLKCAPTFRIDSKKWPNVAYTHLDYFRRTGRKRRMKLTRVDPAQAAKNRRAAQRPYHRPSEGYNLDEFPYASTAQGGKGATIIELPEAENKSHGSALGRFYEENNIQPGDDFWVEVI